MKITPLKNSFDISFTQLASDKSISHRAAIFSLLSKGENHIKNYLQAQDCLNTLNTIKALGAKVENINDGEYIITAPDKIISANKILECGNSGTAMRIFMGLLAGIKDEFFVLSGDMYLNERPMRRITKPLSSVGAKFYGRDNANKAPIAICGQELNYFNYHSPIASAQVKTALILASLQNKGAIISEDELSRDHSEKMLKAMGANLTQKINKNGKHEVTINPLQAPLNPLNISIPNDPSSCFFFGVAAAITKNAKVKFQNILLNPTRIQAFKVLEKMGAQISYEKNACLYDDIGTLTISAPQEGLKAVEIDDKISWLIDEAPALAIAFACANGTSVLKNAKELRVKESDRIAVTINALKACGIKAQELDDGFIITGDPQSKNLKPAQIDSHGDHRIAMSFAILGLRCGMKISGAEFISTSFPNFKQCLDSLYGDQNAKF